MKSKYVIWDCAGSDEFCSLDELQNVDDDYKIYNGISLIGDFPPDAFFKMSEDEPKAIKLSDNIENMSGVPVVSKRLMDFIAEFEPASVEFLPVTIYNHKGRVASKDHFVINPIVIQDCIDLDKTEVRWNPINDGAITGWNSAFTLDEERIDKTLLLFRPKYHTSTILLRTDLAESIEENTFDGVYFKNTEEYEG